MIITFTSQGPPRPDVRRDSSTPSETPPAAPLAVWLCDRASWFAPDSWEGFLCLAEVAIKEISAVFARRMGFGVITTRSPPRDAARRAKPRSGRSRQGVLMNERPGGPRGATKRPSQAVSARAPLPRGMLP